MAIGAMLSLCLTAGLLIFSLIFKVAGKLRLTIPLVYLLAAVVSTFITDWTTENESLVMLGLYILIGLCAFSWIVSLVKAIRRKREEKFFEEDVAWQLQRAREMGKVVDSIIIGEDGTVRDANTGEPIIK